MKKFLYIITLLVSVVFICSGDDSRLQKLKIGVPQFTPFAFRGSNGKITGLAIDELNLWSRKTGVKVLYVLLRSDNLANSIKSGKVDAALVAGNNIGNGAFMYTKALWKPPYALFYDKEKGDKQKVGVILNQITPAYLKHELPGREVVSYSNISNLESAVKAKQVTAFVLSLERGNELADRLPDGNNINIKPLGEYKVYLAALKDNRKIIEEFNRGWAKISQAERDKIMRAWRGATTEKNRKISTKHPLRIAICTETPPLEYTDSYGSLRGFVPLFWQEWSLRTGVPIEFVRAENWNETIKLVESGKADIHSGLFKNATRENQLMFCDKSYHTSKIFFYFDSTLYGLKDISDLSGFDVGVVDDSFSDIFLQKKYPQLSLKKFGNSKQMIASAVAGKIKVFVSEAEIASYSMSKPMVRTRFRFHPDRPLVVCKLYPAVGKGDFRTKEIVDGGLKFFTKTGVEKVEKSANQLTIALPPGVAPYIVNLPDGSVTGLAPALYKALSAKSGVQINLIATNSWNQLFQYMKDDKVDMFAYPCPANSESEYELMPTGTKLGMHLFYNKYAVSNPRGFNSFRNMLIGVVIPLLSEMRTKFPSLNFVPYQNTNQMLLDYSQNRIKGFIMPEVGIGGGLSHYGLSEFTSEFETPISNHLIYMHARKNDHRTINIYMDQIYKNLLNSSEKKRIFKEWVPRETIDWEKTLIWLGIIFVCVMLLLVWMLFLRREIKRRRKMERELAEQNEFLETVKTVAGIGGMEYDFSRNQMNWTNALYELFEAPEDYAPSYDDLKRFDSFLVMDQKIKHAARHRNINFNMKREELFTTFEGRRRWAELTITLRERRYSGTLVMIGVIKDVTALKEVEQMREDVDRIMRHDLKGPLSGIIGIPEALLEDENLNSEQRELLSYIHDSGTKMLRMINESLVLYKIEIGTFDPSPEPVNFNEIVNQAVVSMHNISEARNSSIETRLDDHLFVMGEPMLCYSALVNLLKNALEAAPEGSNIIVSGKLNKNVVAVTISNPGSVPDDIKLSFFDKYTTSGKKSGTGLGTYSARLLVEAQRGSIQLDTSVPGTVSIHVELPAVSALV